MSNVERAGMVLLMLFVMTMPIAFVCMGAVYDWFHTGDPAQLHSVSQAYGPGFFLTVFLLYMLGMGMMIIAAVFDGLFDEIRGVS